MIFVGTSFWVAVRNRRDRHHEQSVELLRSPSARAMLTTNHVIGETWTFLRRRIGHAAAVHFLDSTQRSPRLVIQRVSSDLESQALKWLRRHDERESSFVDATSFAVMASSRLDTVLAFDGDFTAAGFIELHV